MTETVIYQLKCIHPPCGHEFISPELMTPCPKCGIARLSFVTNADSGCWSRITLKWFQQQTALDLYCAAKQRCEAFSTCTARLGLSAQEADPA